MDDYWIINASNIRPHAYYLDALRKLWFGHPVSDVSHSREFAAVYYGGKKAVAGCLESYARSLLSYGPHEDQHAGEQFYNYCVRLLARQFLIDRTRSAVEPVSYTHLDVYKRQYNKQCGKNSLLST